MKMLNLFSKKWLNILKRDKINPSKLKHYGNSLKALLKKVIKAKFKISNKLALLVKNLKIKENA